MTYNKAAAATFALNKNKSIHRWYSYLEGYSSCMVDSIINEIGPHNITSIYDPFCGTGTTPLVASTYGICSYYCETNPFMRKVIEAKINSVKRLRERGIGSLYLRKFLEHIKNYSYQLDMQNVEWDGFEKFFEADVLSRIKELQKEVYQISDVDTQNIALVLLSSVIVRASKMVRQGDLRFARNGEKKDNDRDIFRIFIEKLKIAIEDIDAKDVQILAETICLADDARDTTLENTVDCIITSPPYLNGTNYIRNTKLELKLSKYVRYEKDIPYFHAKGIVAGINNVTKKSFEIIPTSYIEKYIQELKPVAYDKRIPAMVTAYFNDMDIVIKRLYNIMRDRGYLIMDIGDSQFAGIHIPTHEILIQLCESHGFKLYGEEILRKRRSRNGMVLTQRLLKFRCYKKISDQDIFPIKAKKFIEDMPYKSAPYSGRNWGHPWHSLCSYHGKLKPAIAHFLIKEFTSPGDTVVDPLSGVGTIPLEACLQGRVGIGNDLSELAFCVTKAKLEKASWDACIVVLNDLEKYINSHRGDEEIKYLMEVYGKFGFNNKLSNYFHPKTFKELICARKYFILKLSSLSAAEAMVFTCLLHILHGNRPYALSRTSHSLTPYSPTGDYIYKNVVEHIKKKLILSYQKGEFNNYRKGKALYGDYMALASAKISADIIISSPPFADSIRFYMQNWMRLWLCGWEENDYKKADTIFLDHKQKNNFDIYYSFFQMCYDILKSNGKIILHTGKTKTVDMAEELSKRAAPYFTEIYRGTELVSNIEKHGIKDKGATVAHQYLFLRKNS